jgi:AraC-like DNA-binding protein
LDRDHSAGPDSIRWENVGTTGLGAGSALARWRGVLHPAPSVADFTRSPAGRYVRGEHIVYWADHDGTSGFRVWGAPNKDDVALLCAAIDPRAARSRALAGIADARDLGAVDPALFAIMRDFVHRNEVLLRGRLRAMAILRNANEIGAASAGFFEVVGAPYPVASFVSVPDALGWLGVSAHIERDLERLRAECAGTAPEIVALRAVLCEDDGELDLAAAARRLGMSTRTLQRRLRALGTTFEDERRHTRIRRAQELLRTSDVSLTAVSELVGCSSPAHFTTLFRRVTGETPSAWRARTMR